MRNLKKTLILVTATLMLGASAFLQVTAAVPGDSQQTCKVCSNCPIAGGNKSTGSTYCDLGCCIEP